MSACSCKPEAWLGLPPPVCGHYDCKFNPEYVAAGLCPETCENCEHPKECHADH